MPTLECVDCDEGQCHMEENSELTKDGKWWPSDCMKGVIDFSCDWCRVKAVPETLTKAEWEHLISVIQLDAMSGCKASINLSEKLLRLFKEWKL